MLLFRTEFLYQTSTINNKNKFSIVQYMIMSYKYIIHNSFF